MTERHLNETNIQTFACLAEKLGGADAAENALRNLGVPAEIYQAFYEDYIAKHIHEAWAVEARLHRWDNPEP
jgi:hypothetical protein